MSGYQRLTMALSSPCSVRTRVCNNKLSLSRFKLAGPPTPRDTEASNAHAIMHDSLGPVCICSLIGINSILEFPVKVSDLWQITNFRRMREHRQLTFLLNVLLTGHTTIQPRRSRHLWAIAPEEGIAGQKAKWVQEYYFANFGEAVRDELSPLTAETLEEVDAETYYATVGHDGRGLRVPSDLDDSICCYMQLSKANRDKFG